MRNDSAPDHRDTLSASIFLKYFGCSRKLCPSAQYQAVPFYAWAEHEIL